MKKTAFLDSRLIDNTSICVECFKYLLKIDRKEKFYVI